MGLDITMMRFFMDNFEDSKKFKEQFETIEQGMKNECNKLEKVLKSEMNPNYEIKTFHENKSGNTFLVSCVFISFKTNNGELKLQADIGGDYRDNWCINLFYQKNEMSPHYLADVLKKNNIDFLESADNENWIKLELHKIGETSVEQIKNRMIHYVEQLKSIGLLN